MQRTISGAAVALATLLATGLTTGCSVSEDTKASVSGETTAAVNGEAAAALKRDMRKLWTDHVVWTRLYVMEAVADQPDAAAAAGRLMKNQEDIGAAVAKYYGEPAGQQMTTLLKEHITIAVDLIKAAKSGDKTGQKAADDRWQQNADQIATFLSGANPNLPKGTVLDLMKTHLKTTTDEVVARLTKNWDDDVQAFDRVYDHILMMSDAISDGIVKQFPDKFK
jgi:hypothetical protein